MSAPSPRALALHVAACERGEAGYVDPDSGYFVMTSRGLVDRGACCGNGCRHCPFPAAERLRAGRPDLPSWPHPA